LKYGFASQVCGLVFEAGESISHLAHVVGQACQRLSAANIPHNLFVVDCGQRIFLFPNAFARAKAQGQVPEDLLESQVHITLLLCQCAEGECANALSTYAHELGICNIICLPIVATCPFRSGDLICVVQVDPAAFEISGHIIFKRGRDYDNATQETVWQLLSYASYSEADVLEIARKALDF
jgi:GDP-L-galactose phosphorylase